MSDITEPARIERDLDQTRARLGSHLSELQGRLSPGQVIDDLTVYFRGKEGAEFGRTLLDSVRANPLPAALTGIGLAWLMASNTRAAASATSQSASNDRRHVAIGSASFFQSDPQATMAELRAAERNVVRDPDEAEHAYSARVESARGQALGLARHATESTESFGQRVQNAFSSLERIIVDGIHDLQGHASGAAGATGSALAAAGSTAQGAAKRAGGALTQGGQAAGQMGGDLVTALADSPVLLSALGIAAGALLGGLLPQSDQEEKALGGLAGQARDTARSLAHEGWDRGSQVAHAVLDQGHDSMAAQGLSSDKSVGNFVDAALSGKLAESAAQVAQDVMRSGDDAVRKGMQPNPTGSTPAASPPPQHA